jgi:dCTP deaminase
MFLSDIDIMQAIGSKDLIIEPFVSTMLQPASIDLRLDNVFKFFDHDSMGYIDPRKPVTMKSVEVTPRMEYITIVRGQFALASTVEKITLSEKLVGRLEGKSSVGRLGLTTHVTAGFFDPGFSGYATLELFNASDRPIRLYPNMKIAQMSFAYLKTPTETPYGAGILASKYQNQERGPQESAYHRNFENKDSE